MESREAICIGVRAEGLDADRGRMPVHELVDVLSAVANISRRATLLVATRKLSIGPTDRSSTPVLVRSPQSGSFIVELAVEIGVKVAANVAADLIFEVIKGAYAVATGREQGGLPQRIEPSLPWPDQRAKLTPPSREEIAELSEALHPSFKQLSEPVDESATTISLYDATRAYKRGSELLTIDRTAKEELAYEDVGSTVELFGGRVRALNDRTRKGIFDLDAPRPRDLQSMIRSLRFWVSDISTQQQIVAALAANLASNNAAGGASQKITVKARRVTTRTGRIKRILVDGLT
jgi:hypothetical protein